MISHYSMECILKAQMDECKRVLADFRCPTHKNKVRVSYGYDDDGTYAYITKCCCPQFAKQVSEILLRKDIIDKVDLDKCKYTHV